MRSRVIHWYLQRITGALLLVLLVMHFWLVHYMAGPVRQGELTFEVIRERISNPWMQAIDANTDLREGVFVPFFGIQACTTAGVARFAIRTNALIFPMFAIWDRNESRYVVYNGQPIEPSNTGNPESDVLETTIAFTSEIEKIIRRFPEQWLWTHRRWKTRPPGEADLY